MKSDSTKKHTPNKKGVTTKKKNARDETEDWEKSGSPRKSKDGNLARRTPTSSK